MTRLVATLASLCILLMASCGTTTPNPYPPFDGRWLYDYAASADQGPKLPADFGEAISRLNREGRTEENRRLEAIAMKLRAPEILRIEYLASTMSIRGGGGFRRDYELSNLNPTPGVEVNWNMVVLEAKLTDESIEMTERYELSPDRRHLHITITMSTPALEEPLRMRWIYLSAAAF
jgi:hypothetical protein